MLVDNEEDNKTHRPVAPKDVSLGFRSSCAMCHSQMFLLKKNNSFYFFWNVVFDILVLVFLHFFFIQAPKKLVRYHGNQVVTTKGERYQLVKKDETEDMKKTYVNLKPARKYRFHWWRAQPCKSSYWTLLFTLLFISLKLIYNKAGGFCSCVSGLFFSIFFYHDMPLFKRWNTVFRSVIIFLELVSNAVIFWWVWCKLCTVEQPSKSTFAISTILMLHWHFKT